MTDIVKRLRAWDRPVNPDGNIFTDAAVEIERLRSALQTLLDCGNAIVGASEFDPEAEEAFAMYANARLIARQSLSRTSGIGT